MLHEGRNAHCRSGRDKCTNFFKLIVLKRDGDLRGGHTKDHTMQKAPIECGSAGTPALVKVTAVGFGEIERGRRRGADLNARDLLQGRLGPVYDPLHDHYAAIAGTPSFPACEPASLGLPVHLVQDG